MCKVFLSSKKAGERDGKAGAGSLHALFPPLRTQVACFLSCLQLSVLCVVGLFGGGGRSEVHTRICSGLDPSTKVPLRHPKGNR